MEFIWNLKLLNAIKYIESLTNQNLTKVIIIIELVKH